MRIQVLDEAAREYDEAAEYYERQEPGLGLRFADDVDRAVAAVLDFPQRGSSLASPRDDFDVRAVLLSTFTFRLIYVLVPDALVIVAIMHTSRRPDYWRKRLAALR